jgi:N-methylhydantoinase A
MSAATPCAVKLTCDVGGTFTDVVVSDANGQLAIGKSLTTYGRLGEGLLSGIGAAAERLETDAAELLRRGELFVYSTTQATNAILTGSTAKTALLCTRGFPDILVRREGGSMHPYDFTRPYPEPYIPKRLTFEIDERIGADGDVVQPLDEEQARATLTRLGTIEVEAIAVCLLWCTANAAHEQRLGELIEEELPGVAYTLSHRLNPIVREYRRASCTAIDASLKPLMQRHLQHVEKDLRAAGFAGELVAATSIGGVLPMTGLIERPVYAAKSGPSLAPVAGRVVAPELETEDVIVCDTGGTSFDVSLIRGDHVVFTRETWLGEPFAGHLTGLSSVDVRSIGAGGGSIAWIDPGGLLRVGPQSAGSTPGPACYGNGGERPTVTDAAVVLGWLDPERFLGGTMALDVEAARRVVATIAEPLGMSVERAAAAIMTVANEHMVSAIKELTVNQGIDPRKAGIVAGGGAAGLGIAEIARALGCKRVLLPRTAGALSAFGGQHSDIVVEAGRSITTSSGSWDSVAVLDAFAAVEAELEQIAEGLRRRGVSETRIVRSVEARYAHQVWTLDIDVARAELDDPATLEQVLIERFHAAHERIFAVSEPGQRIEVVHGSARLIAEPHKPEADAVPATDPHLAGPATRRIHVEPQGAVQAPVHTGGSLAAGATVPGPALLVEPTTTIVVPPDCVLRVTASGNYLIEVR